MDIALYALCYLAIGVFAASFFRKRFNGDYADALIEIVVALFWPLSVAGMLGALAGDFARKRK